MKKIIIDMKDISLHKEVYDKNPKIFFVYFIWSVFLMVIIALLWAYFGRMDIVIRAQGVIRPYTETETVINHLSGDIVTVNFVNGMHVNTRKSIFRF